MPPTLLPIGPEVLAIAYNRENDAGPQSLIEDHRSGQVDNVSRNKNSPSQSAQAGSNSLDNPGDVGLIDLEVFERARGGEAPDLMASPPYPPEVLPP